MLCAKCKAEKHEDEFGPVPPSKSRGGLGKSSYCRACAAARSRAIYHQNREKRCAQAKVWRAANPERLKQIYRRHSLRSLYGLSEADFAAILEAQGGACAICRESLTRPFVDHDHDTGTVRGLLCPHCNSMLGYARDNRTTLANAINYLALHSVRLIKVS